MQQISLSSAQLGSLTFAVNATQEIGAFPGTFYPGQTFPGETHPSVTLAPQPLSVITFREK